MKLRIHHFFDIIRDIGKGIEFTPHPYGHAYHKIAERIRTDRAGNIELVMGCDDICTGCVHKINNHCDDSIHHAGFPGKEKYNDCIDARILEACGLRVQDQLTVEELCRKAGLYIEKMESIYTASDPLNTEDRKLNVRKGLKILSS